MREIKFRYWDMKRKEFIKDCDVYFIAEDHILAGDLNNPPLVDITGSALVSQFTGLKDKYGVDIYESDIYENVHGVRWVIYYDDDVAGYLANAINRNYIGQRFSGRGDIIQGEVIGNIHEHKHLLEGEPIEANK